MKSLITLSAFLILSIAGNSQKSNLIFFAENGEPFTIIMNGLKYNEVPATNIKLTDLTAPATYKVKAIFQDASLGEVNKTIPLDPFKEYTFNIRPRKEGNVVKGVKDVGKTFAVELGGADTAAMRKREEEREKYVMRFVSETPLVAPVVQQQVVVVPPPAASTTTVVTQPGRVTQTTQTTTTTVGAGAVNTTGAAVNVSVNDPDLGVNFNMNVGTPVGTVHQTTTTTTTTGGAVVTQNNNHYIMPGYSGMIGCPWPMDQGTFSNALATVSGQSFEENRFQIAQQIFNSNCMTVNQVTQIIGLFSFEDTKLDFAKYAYGRTYDLSNYFMVNNSFSFSSSVDDLNAYINSQPRR
jgi:hypothetical protein